MNSWEHNRTSFEADGFLDSVSAAGISAQNWDSFFAPFVDDALRGVSDDKFDVQYPIRTDGLRVLFIEASPAFGIPAARIAFRLEPPGRTGEASNVCYVRFALIAAGTV